MADKIWKEQEFCATCVFPLDLGAFPKDYPKEWMFCCSCLSWAKFITDSDGRACSDEEINVIIKNSPTISKIYNKITLVEGNDK